MSKQDLERLLGCILAAALATELTKSHLEGLQEKLGREWIGAWHAYLTDAFVDLELCLSEVVGAKRIVEDMLGSALTFEVVEK